jgi:hypothetical protein
MMFSDSIHDEFHFICHYLSFSAVDVHNASGHDDRLTHSGGSGFAGAFACFCSDLNFVFLLYFSMRIFFLFSAQIDTTS